MDGLAEVSVPRVSDPPEVVADWVELYALRDKDGNASLADLRGALTISGSADAEDPDEDADTALPDEEVYEGVAEAAFQEIADRVESCRPGVNGYPFTLTGNAVSARNDAVSSVYTFLLLLSAFGESAASDSHSGAKLFEVVSARAAESYLGGRNQHTRSLVFGFPRSVGPRGFADAIDDLCRQLQEGRGHQQRPRSRHQKDAKLDVVAWRGFADARQGKLIVFGQCATGTGWLEKTHELPPPHDWWTMWMLDRPAVWPVRAFFVPHRVAPTDWLDACTAGGILFDRCRLVQHSSLIDPGLTNRLADWSRGVIARHLHRAESAEQPPKGAA